MPSFGSQAKAQQTLGRQEPVDRDDGLSAAGSTDDADWAIEPRRTTRWYSNHKLRNVLDVVALKHQPAVRARLQQIAAAGSKAQAERMRRDFRKSYECVHPKAVERLERDWERMISYYAFPKEHWTHIRTTNIIESPFSAVRLRTGAAKRFRRVENATALIWKMLLGVEQRFRKLNAPHLLAEIYAGVI